LTILTKKLLKWNFLNHVYLQVEENQVKHAENIKGTFERSYFKLSLRRTNLYSTIWD
jgi:hypothetical protein